MRCRLAATNGGQLERDAINLITRLGMAEI